MKKQTTRIATLTALLTYAFNLHSAAFDPNDPPQHLGPSLTSRMTRAYIRDLLSVERYRSAFVSKEAFEHAGLVLPHMSIERMLPDIAQEHRLYQLREWQGLLTKIGEIERNEPDISFESLVEKLQYPFSQARYERLKFFHYLSLEMFFTELFDIPKQPDWLQSSFSGGFSVKDLSDNDLLQNYLLIKFYPNAQRHNQSKVAVRFYDNAMIDDLIGIQDILDIEKTTDLYLHNKITYVDAGALCTLKNLKHLSLAQNCIASLSPEAFVGLNNLITLDLSSNLLTAIPVGTFSNLSCLKELNLKVNKIPESERARIQAEIPNAAIEW